jgi:hypothetical protein
MAFGKAEFCAEDVKQTALQTFVDRLVPGIWEYAANLPNKSGRQPKSYA